MIFRTILTFLGRNKKEKAEYDALRSKINDSDFFIAAESHLNAAEIALDEIDIIIEKQRELISRPYSKNEYDLLEGRKKYQWRIHKYHFSMVDQLKTQREKDKKRLTELRMVVYGW